MLSIRSDARAEQSPRPTKGAASTEIKALKEAHATEVRALSKEHQTALKEALFEECRKHQDKQQEVVGLLKEALQKAKKKAAEAQVEVSDLRVQVNQEKAPGGARRPASPRLEPGGDPENATRCTQGDDSTVAGTI